MFFKTDAERAAAQAAKARQDAGEAGASAASGARNLGAAVLATLAEVTAPQDDKSGKRHAKRARAKAIKAAGKDRDSATKAAHKAREHGRKAAGHGKKEVTKRGEKAGGTISALAGAAGTRASLGAQHAAESARTHGAHAAEVVKDKAGPLGERAGETAGAGAALIAALAAAARDKAAETRDRAVTGVDHGIDAAVPRAQEGVAAVAPKVDHLRDMINEELLPKIQAMLGDVQTGKDRVLSEEHGAVAAVTGAPKKPHRKGGLLIALGLLAAAGAGLAWWLGQQDKAPATDPWATPAGKTDPWASTASTSAPTGASTVGTGTAAAAPLAGVSTDDATTTTATTESAGGPDSSAFGVGGTTTGTDTEPRMLDTDEIDDLGTEEPPSVDEQGTGETPTEEIEAARKKDEGGLLGASSLEDEARSEEDAPEGEPAEDEGEGRRA